MRAFFRQLRERHVVKVAIAYLVFAWVVLQLADVVLPAMQLPDWTITLTLGLLAVGFPVALLLAWIFDITPEGIQRTDGSNADVTALIESDSGSSGVEPDRSIVVLPFPDLSAEQDQQHFCDGLTEELLNVLTRIPDLRVASRTSSFALKGKVTDLAEVAEKLRVAHVLEGSVRKAGNQVRITAQLTEVHTDTSLWSETYDRELCDIFAIQDDIAKRIFDVLEVKFGPACLPEPTTESAKAYEYFLRGRGYAINLTVHETQRAIEMFQKAVTADPGFVRAWIELAESSAMQTIFYGGGEDSCDIACEAADKAMQLAPDRSGSYMARGFSHLAAHRYSEAEQDFLKALEIDPGQVRAWYYLARSTHHQGQLDKSLDYFTQSTEVNPEDWESAMISLSSFEKKGDVEGAKHMARIGIERIEKHLQDYPDNPRAYYLGAHGLVVLGELERANKWAEKTLALAPDDLATHYNLACFYARIGEHEKALDLLENSIQSRSWIENDPDLDPLRAYPRYKAYIESLPE